ncbi:HEPN domain-containing protein [Saccharospirillum alexandrii]|uniref:HEPN domain-containing protein n=1 Tax=Saccharospirillum alexandrii TaxID=2448477 RepID=UPI000FD768D3|nr:HEPN domain-containing protein [Saccharospirillum alexandrii]
MKVFCRTVLANEEVYAAKLLEDLKSSIFDAVNLDQKGRITSKIYLLTGLYTTHLLSRGYSPTYLFNRAEMFTRENNYQGRSFLQQFEAITERLRTYTTEHEVCFAIRANKPNSLLTIDDDSVFTFMDEIPAAIQGQDREKLIREFTPNVIASATVETTDHIGASWYVKDKLDQLLDTVTALDLNPKIQISSHCVTIARHPTGSHTKAINISFLLGFLSSEGGTYFSSSNASIRHAFSKLDEQGEEQLGRSLRYLRLARESVSMEQKLLNLWIALESLYTGGQSTILSNIIEYVPQIYAVAALSRRVRYLRDLLVKARAIAPQRVRDEFGLPEIFDEEVTGEQIFLLLRNEGLTIELFNSLAPKEHLKYKIMSTFEEMKTNATIAKRIRNSEIDVERQLKRIYFLRNKIAHTGHYSNIRPQLITHLLDYLASCYLALSVSAENASSKNGQSVDELFAGYKMGADIVLARVNSDCQVDHLSELVPVPVG